MSTYEDLAQSVISGNEPRVQEITKALVEAGNEPMEIINKGLVAGMDVVGARFKVGEMFIPEVLIAARSMAAGIDIVRPLMAGSDILTVGKVLIGTVKGDLHDIGKNLVAMMLEGSGFKVINMGIDKSPEEFAAAVKEHQPDIVGMSALLTTTMVYMKDTIELLKEEGLRDKVKIVIGGAPTSQKLADEIDADGYAPDATSATDLCKRLIS